MPQTGVEARSGRRCAACAGSDQTVELVHCAAGSVFGAGPDAAAIARFEEHCARHF
jgi:hypothetical protein